MPTGHPAGSLRGDPIITPGDDKHPGFLILGFTEGLDSMKLRAFPLAPPDKATQATLLLVREEQGEIEVKILGPTADQVVKVAGPGQLEVPLAVPGMAVVDAPGGYRPVFAEPGVKIIVKI